MDQYAPPVNRPEWISLIRGEIKFNKYPLQMLSDRLRKEISSGSKPEKEAIEELRQFFLKYKNAFKPDLVEVFGEW
jgi:hypothetical protein